MVSIREIEDLFAQDVHVLGERADAINRNNGNRVTFIVNRHINYTNICVAKCPLCAFYRDQNDSDAYLLSGSEVVSRAEEAVQQGATELHIVGSLNPAVCIEYFEDIFKQIRKRFPGVCIKALTATEIHFLAQIERMSEKEVLLRLRDAGLQALPGGGAEILNDDIRAIICPRKLNASEWLRIMEIAHRIGLRSNATMLFGHVEQISDRALHLYRLWELQEKTHGFVSFIPLVFHPDKTELGMIVREKTNPLDVLKTIAVSRIVLSNFSSIRAYWVALGVKLAQVALNYGANDLDGTLMGEQVTHAAGANTPQVLTIEHMLELIKGADRSKTPAERDTFYNIRRIFATSATSTSPGSYSAPSSSHAQEHLVTR